MPMIPKGVREFTDQHGIDVEADIGNRMWWPRFGRKNIIDDTISEHMTETGADYHLTQIEYVTHSYNIGTKARAARMIAVILAGMRTELAYWASNAPTKDLTVHRGRGSLVIGNPQNGITLVTRLSRSAMPHAEVEPGLIYTFEADPDNPEPFVISGFYRPPPPRLWSDWEVFIQPGESLINTRDGSVQVPEDFRTRYAAA